MSDTIQVEYDRLQTIISQFNQHAENIASMQKNLRSAYAPLEGGDWMGKGAGAFFNKMNSEVFPSVDKLNQALQLTSQITQQVVSIFHNAEQEAAAIFKGDGDFGGGDGSRGGNGSSGSGNSSGGSFWDKLKGNFKGGILGVSVGGALKTFDVGQAMGLPIPLKVDLGKWNFGLGVGKGKDGFFAGLNAGFTTVSATSEGTLVGDKNLGLTAGVTVAGPSVQAQAGIYDGSLGAKIGGSLISAKGAVGVNVLGKNASVTGEIGVKWELGFSIGKKTEVKLGPVSFGIDFGGAK